MAITKAVGRIVSRNTGYHSS